jgi:hypothetical protein
MPDPGLQLWRGVSVHESPEQVWPWVVQIRLAPYSYDWIDNLGRRSPQQLHDLADPLVGQPFSTALGRPVGRILAVSPCVHLTGQIMGAVMSYVLVPDGQMTRLLLKVVWPSRGASAPLLSLGDLVMARRQLLNLRLLAERAKPS